VIENGLSEAEALLGEDEANWLENGLALVDGEEAPKVFALVALLEGEPKRFEDFVVEGVEEPNMLLLDSGVPNGEEDEAPKAGVELDAVEPPKRLPDCDWFDDDGEPKVLGEENAFGALEDPPPPPNPN
jgi:hypothetical protein